MWTLRNASRRSRQCHPDGAGAAQSARPQCRGGSRPASAVARGTGGSAHFPQGNWACGRPVSQGKNQPAPDPARRRVALAASTPCRFRQVHPEAIPPALMLSDHLGRGVTRLLPTSASGVKPQALCLAQVRPDAGLFHCLCYQAGGVLVLQPVRRSRHPVGRDGNEDQAQVDLRTTQPLCQGMNGAGLMAGAPAI